MNDLSAQGLLLEMNAKLARVEARLDAAADSRNHIRKEISDVKTIAAANRTAITLAKGGFALATFASACAGFLAFFSEPVVTIEPRLPSPIYYPAPEPFEPRVGVSNVDGG